MVAADQGCECSALLFSREVGIWKTTCDKKRIGLNENYESVKKTRSHTAYFILKNILNYESNYLKKCN